MRREDPRMGELPGPRARFETHPPSPETPSPTWNQRDRHPRSIRGNGSDEVCGKGADRRFETPSPQIRNIDQSGPSGAFPAIYALPAGSTAIADPEVKTGLKKQELPFSAVSHPGCGPVSVPAYRIWLPDGSILAKNAPEMILTPQQDTPSAGMPGVCG